MPSIGLAPWPGGADNVRDEHASPFQVAKGKRARLVEAVNVDLNDEGWPKTRSGTTDRRTGTDYRGLASCAGLLLLQDGGTIYKINTSTWTATSLVTGLHATTRVQFHEFDENCFYTNGIVCGKILAAGTATHWGMTPPSAPVATTSGTACSVAVEDALTEGRYRVSATTLDAAGAESGASPATDVEVDGSSGISVNVVTTDSNAAYVCFYITTAGQDEMCWTKTVAVGSLPTTITNSRVSQRPLLNQFLRNPVPGAGLFSYLGYMFTFKDNTAFRSRGQVPNLFHPRSEVLTFTHDVRGGAGLQDGFYVSTAKGLYWISGKEPASWRSKKVDDGVYAYGSLVLPGEDFPSLKTSEMVGFMASDDGLVALLPGGEINHVTDQRLALSTSNSVADLAFRKPDDLRQVLMCLQ